MTIEPTTGEIVAGEYREIQLGALSVQGPQDVIQRAVMVAGELARIIRERKLSRGISGREYVFVEGWTTLGAMLGVTPREVPPVIENAAGDFEAVVELVRVSDGAVIGRGSAIVGADEPTWAKRPRYARRSMAITRATGKAFRLSFSWVMKLAGFEPTPAEEMEPDEQLRRPTNGSANALLYDDPTEAAPVASQPAELQPEVKRAVMKGLTNANQAEWQKRCKAIAEKYPKYQTTVSGQATGKPNYMHILGAAAKAGYAEVTDSNFEIVLEAVAKRAAEGQAA